MGYVKRFLAVLFLAAAVPLLAASFSAAAPVQVVKKEGIGQYIADEKGYTLYTFTVDAPGKSECTGQCLKRWFIFSAENITVPPGVRQEDFASFKRPDGRSQTSYKGKPLYYFYRDQNPGEVKGHEHNGAWFVAVP